MKRSWSLIAAAAAILLLLFYLSSSAKKPPLIPADAAHAGLVTNESCAPCHAPGMRSPLKETHPPKEQCLVCHKIGKGGSRLETTAALNEFDWEHKGPVDFLELLKTYHGTYIVQELHKYWVRAEDLPRLVKLIDSDVPCAPVTSAISSVEFGEDVRSFIGLEALFIIEGYQAGQYPPGITSMYATKKNAVQRDFQKRKSIVFSWYDEKCNSDGDSYLECNDARARKYLGSLSKKDVGRVLEGFYLTDGKPVLNGYRYVGKARNAGKGVHLYIFELNKQNSSYLWVEKGGEEFPLPT